MNFKFDRYQFFENSYIKLTVFIRFHVNQRNFQSRKINIVVGFLAATSGRIWSDATSYSWFGTAYGTAYHKLYSCTGLTAGLVLQLVMHNMIKISSFLTGLIIIGRES